MAERRERPYSQFNYLVDLGTGDTTSAEAGFSEVSGLGVEVNVAEYRNGNEKSNTVRKIPGSHKVTDVTLKRGVIGTTDLYGWLNEVRSGDQNARRDITIQLMAEDQSGPVVTWRLFETLPIKYTGPTFNAAGTEVAIEELVLACERIQLDDLDDVK